LFDKMSLATGTRLGPYEILARIGAGGMGEVYPDGTPDEKPITHVTFLLNFFDELRRRVPVGR
jgi:hypothetical protein